MIQWDDTDTGQHGLLELETVLKTALITVKKTRSAQTVAYYDICGLKSPHI